MSTYIYFGMGMLACSFVILYVNSFYLKIVLLSFIFLYLHLKINKCIRQSNKRSIFTQLSDDDEEYQDRKVLRNRSASLDNKFIVYDRNGRKRCIRHDSVYDHTNSKSNLIDDDTSSLESDHCSRQSSCTCSEDEGSQAMDCLNQGNDTCTECQDQKQTSRKSSCTSTSTQDMEDEPEPVTGLHDETDDDQDSSSSNQDSSSSDQDSSCDEYDDEREASSLAGATSRADVSSTDRTIREISSLQSAMNANEDENKQITDDTQQAAFASSPTHEFERQSTYYLCQ